jgi:DNA repair protein RecN (Recombination protein N)
VTGRLSVLAMPGARLEVSVAQSGAGDPVRFGLSANPGEPAQPFQRVASGGELARTMLALRLETMGGAPVLVFDEVDAGVGGEAALALAVALRDVARDHQVLVVTHLPQVAAFADQQIVVEKAVVGERTTATARLLLDEDRVVELSRMLSGHPDSETARAHAAELLTRARTQTGTRRRSATPVHAVD